MRMGRVSCGLFVCSGGGFGLEIFLGLGILGLFVFFLGVVGLVVEVFVGF